MHVFTFQVQIGSHRCWLIMGEGNYIIGFHQEAVRNLQDRWEREIGPIKSMSHTPVVFPMDDMFRAIKKAYPNFDAPKKDRKSRSAGERD